MHASAAGADDDPHNGEAHLRRGVEFRHLGRNDDALREFQQAFAIEPSPRARAQIALALQALGSWLEAERGLVEALEARDDRWIERYRPVLEGALADVRRHLGWLLVETNVTEGDLLVGGTLVRRLPISDPVRVVAGTIDVQIRAPERVPMGQTVAVPENGTAHARLALEPVRGTPEQAPRAPASPTAIAVTPERPNRPTGSRLGAYVALGGSAALVGIGVAAWIVHQDNAATYNDDQQCLVGALTRGARCGPYADRASVALDIEIGAFVAAAISAAAGVWLLVTPARAQTAVAEPWCALGAGSIACGGRF